MRETIKNLLINRGIPLSQGTDGRVEVPQFIIKAYNWDNQKEFFVYCKTGEILLYPEFLGESYDYAGKFKISNGRIRIPYGVIKNKPKLLVCCATDNCIVLRPDNGEANIDGFINTLTESQINNLSNVLLGRLDAKLLLLNEGKPNLFRLVGKPIVFSGYYIANEKKIYLTNNKAENFYLLPGILREGSNKMGFLLIGEEVFGSIKYVFERQKIIERDNIELLFLYEKYKDGHFKVFTNPNSDFFNDDIETTKQVCSNPKKFLLEHFDQAGHKEADRAWFISSSNIKGEK